MKAREFVRQSSCANDEGAKRGKRHPVQTHSDSPRADDLPALSRAQATLSPYSGISLQEDRFILCR